MTTRQLFVLYIASLVFTFACGYMIVYRALAPVQSCCTDVAAQLETITECKDFVIVDRDGCGPCTDYQIAERMGPEQLDCGPYYTEVVGSQTFVTMGEAQP